MSFKYPSQDFHSQIYNIYPTYSIIFKQLFSGKIHILHKMTNLHSFYLLCKKLSIKHLTEEKNLLTFAVWKIIGMFVRTGWRRM